MEVAVGRCGFIDDLLAAELEGASSDEPGRNVDFARANIEV